MDELGNATCSTYCGIWVVSKDIIYLVMDNAGGHRKDESVLEYSDYLSENYNIVVHHKLTR